MGDLFSLFGSADQSMDAELARAHSIEGSLVVDVREPFEYQDGHVPGAVNIPLGQIPSRLAEMPDKAAAIFLYCASGARSSRAAAYLKSLGYTDITDMGSIRRYRGTLER